MSPYLFEIQSSAASGERRLNSLKAWFSDYLELSKLRLSSLVVITTWIGILLAPGSMGILNATLTIFATSLLVAAANIFNCVLEVDVDALMERTKNRPLPTGKRSPREAVFWGTVFGLTSLLLLAQFSNLLTTALGALAFISYVACYTPLKRISMSALFVGAIPGAIPPVMGWTAAANSLSVTAWILFAILFFWQLPHFIAIAIFRADDYARAGLKTLPQALGTKKARWHMLLYAAGLVCASLAPVLFNQASQIYALVTIVLGFSFIALCVAALQEFEFLRRTRLVFFATLIYLPVILGLWVFDTFLRSAIG